MKNKDLFYQFDDLVKFCVKINVKPKPQPPIITDVSWRALDNCDPYRGYKDGVKFIQDRGKDYKFHITKCQTIANSMWLRYKNIPFDQVLIEELREGIFIHKFPITEKQFYDAEDSRYFKEYEVCKHCLLKLRYKGYTNQYDYSIFFSFNLKEYVLDRKLD